jgi:hypothetical protein
MKFFRHFSIPILLFTGVVIIYLYIYPNPRNWYDHYLYLGKSLIAGRVDIPNLPEFYHDKVIFDGRTYVPFPPGASILLIPFILTVKDITQQQVSVIIGALNISLIYFLLIKFTDKTKAVILSIFFALGTVHFWSAVVGTTWYFAHVVSIFYLLISLILHFNQKPLFSGIFFTLASLTRLPILLAGIFYLLSSGFKNKKIYLFILGASIFVPITLGYNYLRFGNVFENGYRNVYNQYATSSYPYTIRQVIDNQKTVFGYFDIKNIPQHLYTLFIMPPDIDIKDGIINHLKPSPFGMGIVFTSPLLLLLFFQKHKQKIERINLITALIVAVPSLLHVMQGWVQFGYRFILDYIVFLMIVLSINFKLTKLNLFLIFISIIVNFWGVIWAINLGW